MEYDIAIIGTGPAGLSAAIEATVRHKKTILLGSKDLSAKISKGQVFENYLGLPNITGTELNQKFLDHLNSMNISITDAKVNAIYSMGNYFNIQVDNDYYKAKSVILATGISFGKPYIGEEEYLGKGVSYCATCDGNLYKNKVIAIISNNKSEENEIRYLNSLASKVYFFPLYKEIGINNIDAIKEIPTTIIGDKKVQKLVTDKNEYIVDGIFILRESISPKNLVPGLKVNDNEVITNRNMETNIKGLFACGDITGKPYQSIKAAGEGNIAALSAISYLDNLEK